MDRSCHNPMRDGRTFIDSELNADIPLNREEWPALAQVFEEFANTNGWSFRDDSDRYAAGVSLSVCTAEGTQITAMRLSERGVSIGVYEPQGGSGWEHPTQQLLLMIERRWPGRLGFTNGRGENIEAPAFLARDAAAPVQPEAP
jgi:hypothetical protein